MSTDLGQQSLTEANDIRRNHQHGMLWFIWLLPWKVDPSQGFNDENQGQNKDIYRCPNSDWTSLLVPVHKLALVPVVTKKTLISLFLLTKENLGWPKDQWGNIRKSLLREHNQTASVIWWNKSVVETTECLETNYLGFFTS